MARPNTLSRADQQLWAAFSQTIAPLPGRLRLSVEPAPTPPLALSAAPRALPPKPAAPAAALSIGAVPGGLDKATWRKFSNGQIRAATRLDLHGFTAARAHHAVIHAIERAHAEQTRCIEIITGKGEVLARELPHWLNAPSLRPLILAVTHPHAANTGSVRLLLRRLR